MSAMERWMGGSPVAVLLKLLVLSLIVGVLLSAFGLTPLGLLHQAADAIRAVLDLGFDAVRDFGRYLLTGAMIVIPLWLLSRFLGGPRR